MSDLEQKNKIGKQASRAVFIDRDGVLNKMIERGIHYRVQGKEVERTAPFSLDELVLCEGVEDALVLLGEMSFLRILISNQPDVSYGTLPVAEHAKIMNRIQALPLDDVFICLHGRDVLCECKKPRPGMLLSASEKWGIDLNTSYMIGDSQSDIGAAQAVGCTPILIRTFYNQDTSAQYEAPSLLDAVRVLRDLERPSAQGRRQ